MKADYQLGKYLREMFSEKTGDIFSFRDEYISVDKDEFWVTFGRELAETWDSVKLSGKWVITTG